MRCDSWQFYTSMEDFYGVLCYEAFKFCFHLGLLISLCSSVYALYAFFFFHANFLCEHNSNMGTCFGSWVLQFSRSESGHKHLCLGNLVCCFHLNIWPGFIFTSHREYAGVVPLLSWLSCLILIFSTFSSYSIYMPFKWCFVFAIS